MKFDFLFKNQPGSMESRAIFRKMATECVDKEMNAVMDSYMKECDGE